MTTRPRTNNYFRTQIDAFRKSFRINNVIVSTSLEFAKFISLLILFAIGLFFLALSFKIVLPLLGSLDQINTSVSDQILEQILSQSSLLGSFILWAVITILLTILVCSIVAALFNTLILTQLRKEKFSAKKFIRLSSQYLIISLLYFIILFLLIFFIDNFVALTIIFVLWVLIYFYTLMTFQVSLSNKSFWRNTLKSLINVISIHKSIPLFIISVLFLVIIMFLVNILSMLNPYIWILMVPIFALFYAWLTNYMYLIFNHK